MRIRPNRHVAGLLTALLAAGGLAACGTAHATTHQPQVIRIATDLPATSAFGPSEADGVQLAIDDAGRQNLLPGDQLQLLPETGSAGVRAAIADPTVLGLVGPTTSAEAGSDLPAGATAPLAVVSPSAGDRPAGTMPFFRLAAPASTQGTVLADFAYQQKHFRTAYLIDDTQPGGVELANGFAAEWTKLGGKINGHVSVPAGTASYVNALTQAAVTRPDLVFYGGDAATGGIDLRQQMAQVPALKNTPLVGGDGVHTATFARTLGPAAATYSATAGPDGSDNAAFRAAFTARFGANAISTYSAAAYDATMVLIQAVKAAQGHGTPTRAAVQAAVAAISYHGIGTTWAFDGSGAATPPIVTIYTLATDPAHGDGWQLVGS